MATPAPGTIPALPQYQPGALPLTGGEILEIASNATATAAISAFMPLTDVVGKAPSVMTAANPSINDLVAFFQVSSGLPKQCAIGNLSQVAGNIPVSGNTGQLLAKTSAANYDTSWYNLSTFLVAGAGISLAGSTTVTVTVTPNSIGQSQLASGVVGSTQLALQPPVSVLGVAGPATASPTGIQSLFGPTALQSNSGNTGLVWGQIDLGTQIVTGLLSSAHIGVAAIFSQNIATGVVGSTALATQPPVSVLGVAGPATASPTGIPSLGGSFVLQSGSTNGSLVWGTVTVPAGGTNTSTLKANAVLVGAGTSTIQFAAATAAGNLLIDQGSTSNPAFTAMGGAASISSAGFVTLNNFTATNASFGVVSSTTFVNATGLSAAIVTAGVYSLEAFLFATAGSTGGTKVTLACTTAVSNVVYQIDTYNGSTLANAAQYSALLQSLPNTSAVNPSFTIVGTLIAGNAGTLTVQIAQVAATTTTTVLMTGSLLRVLRIA